MNDPRIDKLAEVLVNYSVAVQPGDRTLIQGPVAGAPLLKRQRCRVAPGFSLCCCWAC